MEISDYCIQREKGITKLIDEIRVEDVTGTEYDADLKDIECYKRDYFNNEECDTLIAVEGEEVLGFIIGKSEDPIYDVAMIYVSTKHRGHRLHKRLNEELSKVAKRKGYKSIKADVLLTNTLSIKAYDKLGWIKTLGEYDGSPVYRYECLVPILE